MHQHDHRLDNSCCEHVEEEAREGIRSRKRNKARGGNELFQRRSRGWVMGKEEEEGKRREAMEGVEWRGSRGKRESVE
jgi:hypothetical protein